jgi:hypothetical protein
VLGFLFIGSEVELDFKFVVAMVNPSVLQCTTGFALQTACQRVGLF